MIVKATLDGVRQSHWYEFGLRFVFGGTITVAAGLIASHFGPAVGGLFLAFPAIFPATGTLIEKREKEKKERKGLRGEKRGRRAAGVDAAGTVLGAIALLGFALMVWQLVPRNSPWLVLAAATAAWSLGAMALWFIRKRKLWRRLGARSVPVSQHQR